MKWLNKLEEIFITVTILFATLLVFVNVILRAFNSGIIWSEELIRYLLIWVTFIGIRFCVRKGGHISIEMIPDLLKGKKKFILNTFIILSSILLSILLTWFSTQFVLFSYLKGQQSSALDIPIYLVYIVMPISGLLMSIRYCMELSNLFKEEYKVRNENGQQFKKEQSNKIVRTI